MGVGTNNIPILRVLMPPSNPARGYCLAPVFRGLQPITTLLLHCLDSYLVYCN